MSQQRPRPWRRVALPSLLAAGLGACTVGPSYVAPSIERLGVPKAYPATAASASIGAAADDADLAAWWGVFRDPTLTGLVERANAGNLDIAQSIERLAQAREALVQARANAIPSLTANASAERQDLSVPGGPFQISTATLQVAWAADLFGGIRRSREASAAALEAAGYTLASIRTAAAASVAETYVSYREARERLAIAEDTLKTQDNNAEIAAFRAKAGLVSSLDVEQANAQRAQTAAALPPLRAAATQAEAALAVLIGVAPGSLETELARGSGLPSAQGSVGRGAPLDLLRRRPDVRAAERDLKAATAQIGVAESQLYPQLTLQGQVGSPAIAGAGLIGDSASSALIGSLAQTLFQGGALRAQVRSKEAAARGAYAAYRQTVLKALQDVANASAALASAEGRAATESRAVDASRAAAVLARNQYAAGLIDFQTLLSAEQSLLTARDGLVSATSDQAVGLIQLYLALGGGWRPDADVVTNAPSNGPNTHG